jgi:hypothetical protein
MKMSLAMIAAGLALAAQPALSQTTPSTSGQSAQQNPSQVGVPAKPGSKAGPAEKQSGTTSSANTGPAGADPSGIKGMPGNKSGPAVKQPGHAEGNK